MLIPILCALVPHVSITACDGPHFRIHAPTSSISTVHIVLNWVVRPGLECVYIDKHLIWLEGRETLFWCPAEAPSSSSFLLSSPPLAGHRPFRFLWKFNTFLPWVVTAVHRKTSHGFVFFFITREDCFHSSIDMFILGFGRAGQSDPGFKLLKAFCRLYRSSCIKYYSSNENIRPACKQWCYMRAYLRKHIHTYTHTYTHAWCMIAAFIWYISLYDAIISVRCKSFSNVDEQSFIWHRETT